MPRRALTPCSAPGCPELTAGRRYCLKHRKAEYRRIDAVRPSAAERGYTSPEWKALRLRVLTRDPLCVVCRQVPSSIADHIVPKAQGGQDVLSNLRGVCRQCDSRDTAKYDGGFGNRLRAGKVAR